MTSIHPLAARVLMQLERRHTLYATSPQHGGLADAYCAAKCWYFRRLTGVPMSFVTSLVLAAQARRKVA